MNCSISYFARLCVFCVFVVNFKIINIMWSPARTGLVTFWWKLPLRVQVEVGNNLTCDHSKSRPANSWLTNWFMGKTAALDVSITSPLNPLTLLEAGVLAKTAAQDTEARKHQANDPKCSELGCVCVPPWWLNPMEPGVKRPRHHLIYRLETCHLHVQAKVGGAQ